MSFFYIEMDSNKVDEPMNNQRLPMTPDAGKSDYPPSNNILFLLLYRNIIHWECHCNLVVSFQLIVYGENSECGAHVPRLAEEEKDQDDVR